MAEKNVNGANGAKDVVAIEGVTEATGRSPIRAASLSTALPASLPTALLAVLTALALALALAIPLALPAGTALASGAASFSGDAASPADGADAIEAPVADCDTAFYRAAYLGPEGTYSEEAALMVDGACMYVEREPVASVAEAVRLVVEEGYDFAVVPVENTVGGPVYGYLDELLAHDGLGIWLEVELPVRQALVAAPGTELADVEVVYSHAQGIAQAGAWLAQNLPNAQVVEVASTAEAARMAAEGAAGTAGTEGADRAADAVSDAPTCAAVASTRAAEVYGLDVLAENVQLNDANVTRFHVVSATWGGVGTPAERIAFTAAGSVADLPALLRAVDDQGLVLVSLHGRPAQTELGDYVYLVECASRATGGETPATCGEADFDAIADVCGDRFDLRFLGAFDVERG